MKKFLVCEEIINDKPSKCYSIRVNTDACPSRFIIKGEADSYKEALELRNKIKNTSIA